MGVLKQLGRVLIFRDSPRVPTDLLEKVLIFRDSGGFFVTDRKTNTYESIATVGEIRVWWRADFQSGSRVLKKVL